MPAVSGRAQRRDRNRAGHRPDGDGDRHRRRKRGAPDRTDRDQRPAAARRLRGPAGQRRGPDHRDGHRGIQRHPVPLGRDRQFCHPDRPGHGHRLPNRGGQPTGTVRIGLPAFLGVQILVPSQARRGPPGAVVGPWAAGSPAASTGLVAGDVITSLDGQPVDSGPTLTTLLRRHRPGDTVTFGWTDQQGRPRQATVVLVTGPAD